MNHNAVLKRGIEFHTQGQLDQALADYSQVIDSAVAEDVELMGLALYYRGSVYQRLGEHERLISDMTRIVEYRGEVSAELVAQASAMRGESFAVQGELEAAVSDYTVIIESREGLPTGMLLSALLCRGRIYAEQKRHELAIGELTTVIEQGSEHRLPAHFLAEAYWFRGQAYFAEADYTRAAEDLSIVVSSQWLGTTGQQSAEELLAECRRRLAE
ncbi:tetratricopeptide repeat protein [Gimesia algae]|uniref:Tetratricopeptide repeat protein n=1 Tax=Gimesia algae TaxID=2527971 RepID=A0A517V6V2_9PLAN|nr:tetratricopeptide repeat protein [Gimesia algae]QDT88729.1 Tetratricopeptide repeat protein [Gimesia algae]